MKNFKEEVLKIFGDLESNLDYLAELLDSLLTGEDSNDASLVKVFALTWHQLDVLKETVLEEVAKYE